MNGHPMTDAAAGAAIISPLWLPSLQNVSEVFAMALPIVGVAWLALQIGIKVWETFFRKK